MSSNYTILSSDIPVSMHQKWYDIANEDHFWMIWRFEIFKKVINEKYSIGNRAIDIGCGHGIFKNQVENEFHIPVDGCDLDPQSLAMALTGLGDLFLYNIFDLNASMVNKYDSCFLMDVLEHIDDDVTFLRKCAMHVKIGGAIYINVPAGQYLFSKYDESMGHERRHSISSLTSTIEKAGLEVCTMRYWAFSLIPLAYIRKIIVASETDMNKIVQRGFKPPGVLAHTTLKTVSAIENIIPIHWPIGASLMAVCKKNK